MLGKEYACVPSNPFLIGSRCAPRELIAFDTTTLSLALRLASYNAASARSRTSSIVSPRSHVVTQRLPSWYKTTNSFMGSVREGCADPFRNHLPRLEIRSRKDNGEL